MRVRLGGCVAVDVGGGYHDEAVVGWGVVVLLLLVVKEDRRALPRSGYCFHVVDSFMHMRLWVGVVGGCDQRF